MPRMSAVPEEAADVLRPLDALFEEGFVQLAGASEPSMVKSERWTMNLEREILAVREKREKLHPARIDAGERLVGGRRQAGDRPVVALGRTRDGDAGFGVEAEDLQHLLRLRAAKKLLEPPDVFEPLFQELPALVGVGEVRIAFHPIALLLKIEKLAQALRGLGDHAGSRWRECSQCSQ